MDRYLQIEGVGMVFARRGVRFEALRDISLTVKRGEFVSLIGHSGCGKSTLLNLVAGLLMPTAGHLLLNNREIAGPGPERGVVFQNHSLLPWLTCAGNVHLAVERVFGATEPKSKLHQRTRDALALVGLTPAAAKHPDEISGGMKQRVGIARALAMEPKVLLLDEPFGALDAKVRKELRRWLRRLHDELHITSLFVTHDQDEAIELADRLVLMNKGKVEQTGSVREVYAKPATPFVYSFLGAVNRFTGQVDGDYLRVNGNVMPIAGGGGVHGSDVVAFARPHELDIVAADRGDAVGVPATVSRILDVGAVARVELSGPAYQANGTGKPAEPQFFEVELSAQKLSELNLAAGQPVRLVSSRLRVFDRGAQT